MRCMQPLVNRDVVLAFKIELLQDLNISEGSWGNASKSKPLAVFPMKCRCHNKIMAPVRG